MLFGDSDVLSVTVLDSAANSVGNIDIISCHLAFPSHMICKYWRSFISGTLYRFFVGVLTFEVLDSAANSVGNIDIISYHLAFPSQMIRKYGDLLSLEHYTFWCFLGVLTF